MSLSLSSTNLLAVEVSHGLKSGSLHIGQWASTNVLGMQNTLSKS